MPPELFTTQDLAKNPARNINLERKHVFIECGHTVEDDGCMLPPTHTANAFVIRSEKDNVVRYLGLCFNCERKGVVIKTIAQTARFLVREYLKELVRNSEQYVLELEGKPEFKGSNSILLTFTWSNEDKKAIDEPVTFHVRIEPYTEDTSQTKDRFARYCIAKWDVVKATIGLTINEPVIRYEYTGVLDEIEYLEHKWNELKPPLEEDKPLFDDYVPHVKEKLPAEALPGLVTDLDLDTFDVQQGHSRGTEPFPPVPDAEGKGKAKEIEIKDWDEDPGVVPVKKTSQSTGTDAKWEGRENEIDWDDMEGLWAVRREGYPTNPSTKSSSSSSTKRPPIDVLFKSIFKKPSYKSITEPFRTKQTIKPLTPIRPPAASSAPTVNAPVASSVPAAASSAATAASGTNPAASRSPRPPAMPSTSRFKEEFGCPPGQFPDDTHGGPSSTNHSASSAGKAAKSSRSADGKSKKKLFKKK